MAVEKNDRGWPVLYAAQDLACDGINPTTGRTCVVGQHRGYHRDETGARWIDGEDVPCLPVFQSSVWERHDDPELR